MEYFAGFSSEIVVEKKPYQGELNNDKSENVRRVVLLLDLDKAVFSI